MQLIVVVWCCFLLVFASSIQQQGPKGGSGNVVKPEIVIPGVWKVNQGETFLFLPLDIPSDLSLERVKIMSNGEQILVIVTQQAKDKPETNALKKYRLILDALKQQAGYDERLLRNHLEEWYETEDDEGVRVHIKTALDSLKDVRDAKRHESGPPPTVRIPLGMLRNQALKRNVSFNNASQRKVPQAFLTVTSPHVAEAHSAMKHTLSHMATAAKGRSWATDADRDAHKHLRIIKESFSVDIPFPVSAEQVIILQTPNRDLMVTLPLKRESLEAQGISTGGKPFLTSPVYNLQGQLIGGPDEAADLYSIVPSLKTEYLVKPDALKDLDE